jgi:hypothetical protein
MSSTTWPRASRPNAPSSKRACATCRRCARCSRGIRSRSTRDRRRQPEAPRARRARGDAGQQFFRRSARGHDSLLSAVRGDFRRWRGYVDEITTLMSAMYRTFNAEHGLSLGSPMMFYRAALPRPSSNASRRCTAAVRRAHPGHHREVGADAAVLRVGRRAHQGGLRPGQPRNRGLAARRDRADRRPGARAPGAAAAPARLGASACSMPPRASIADRRDRRGSADPGRAAAGDRRRAGRSGSRTATLLPTTTELCWRRLARPSLARQRPAEGAASGSALGAHDRRGTGASTAGTTCPGSAPEDPYRIWLSEIMLQQTQVAAR